jgi:hypothetical protein
VGSYELMPKTFRSSFFSVSSVNSVVTSSLPFFLSPLKL